jgi:hypothetical protein
MAKSETVIHLRVPSELYGLVVDAAKTKRRSINDWVRSVVASSLGRPDAADTKRTYHLPDKEIRGLDIALEMCSVGQAKGWKKLLRGIRYLMGTRHFGLALKYMNQAESILKDWYSASHSHIAELNNLKARYDRLTDYNRTCNFSEWLPGRPKTTGLYTVIYQRVPWIPSEKQRIQIVDVQEETFLEPDWARIIWHMKHPPIPTEANGCLRSMLPHLSLDQSDQVQSANPLPCREALPLPSQDSPDQTQKPSLDDLQSFLAAVAAEESGLEPHLE